MAPRVLCEAVHVDRIAGDAAGGSVCFRVRAKIANRVSAGLKCIAMPRLKQQARF